MTTPVWPWPEPRLAYANAVLPEAMIAAGTVLDRPALQRQGLDLLAWLLDHETVDGHLSVTPVGGGSDGDSRPAFDQQPIEVAALADACARAAAVDGDRRWIAGLTAAAAWFFGDNDGQRIMCDPATGGGFDGLQADGVEPQPGRRVDAGAALDAAAGPPARRGVDVTAWATDLVRRSPERLAADPSRVITRLFVPGQEAFDRHDSRASPVLDRILALDEDEVTRALDDVATRFRGRHRDLDGTFRRHADGLADRLDAGPELSADPPVAARRDVHQRVRHRGGGAVQPQHRGPSRPDRRARRRPAVRDERPRRSARATGPPSASARGRSTPGERPDVDAPPRFASTGQVETARYEAATFRGELERLGGSGENADFVLDALGEWFTAAELDAQLDGSRASLATRRHADHTITLIRGIAERTYGVRFAADTPLAERVLWPATIAEDHGMEDARFVRFTDDDGTATYFATYTAYDGTAISQQLLETTDFVDLHVVAGRRPGGGQQGPGPVPPPDRRPLRRAVALRPRVELDRLLRPAPALGHRPALPGAGPTVGGAPAGQLRLADRDRAPAGWCSPTASARCAPTASVRSCSTSTTRPGSSVSSASRCSAPRPTNTTATCPTSSTPAAALIHAGTLVLPYGIGDAAIRLATVPVPELLDALQATGH